MKNPNNMHYKIINGGNDTKDKVFLLSDEEVYNPDYGLAEGKDEEVFLGSSFARLRRNTAYSVSIYNKLNIGKDISGSHIVGDTDRWWLRSPGFGGCALFTYAGGSVWFEGMNVEEFYGICPAIHLDLSDDSIWSYAGSVNEDEVTVFGTERYSKIDDNKKLKQIDIGKNINKIGKQAFYKCKNLKKLVIRSKKLTSKNVGSSTFKGVNKNVEVYVPERKINSYKKLLKKKGLKKKW